MAIDILAGSISGLGGLLGGLLHNHSKASKHIEGLLNEAQNAAAAGDWQGVQAIATQIMGTEGASQSMMSGARNLAHAAATAVQTFTTLKETPNLPPAQIAMTTVAQQQLVMSEVSALSVQLHNENSGIWNHLWHAHRLASNGTL